MSETTAASTSDVENDDVLTTESFFMTCKLVGLTYEDMELMTIGECLDYATNYFELKNGKSKEKVRKANQDDMDNF